MKKHQALTALVDFLLPRACVACNGACATDTMVCGLCWSRLEYLPGPRCERCGHPGVYEECSWCENLPRHVRACRSVCWYPGPISTGIVAALKYSDWTAIADEMAERMSRLVMPRDVLQERPLVVPVPLSPQKLRERGYNQSELLARGICRRWDLELIVDSVRRTRSTTTQTRLSPDERKVNVAGAFAVLPEREVQLAGSHLLLVDDVVTTGATLNSCSDALFAAGARIISYITFGRARASGDL